MRVAVERERDAEIARAARERAREIEARGLAVDLERGPGARGRGEDRVVIELVARERLAVAAGRMTDDRDVRILARADDPRGHRLARDVERIVDARDHDVELGEHVVVVIERTVALDIDLGGTERDDTVLRSEIAREAALRAKLVRIEPDAPAAPRVVGDRVIRIALARGRDHALERILPVAPRAMHVEIAAQIAERNGLRERAGERRIEFTDAEPHLGRDERQADRRIDLFLGAARRIRTARDVEHAVLAHAQPLAHRVLAQLDVVLSRTGKVLK